MAEKEKYHPESGDNPEEREKLAGKQHKEDSEQKEQRDLESGDNREERERISE